VLEGNLSCGDTLLGRRDSIGLRGVDEIAFQTAWDATNVLLAEVAMVDDEVIKNWEREHPGH
jgi:hypothetical protein